MIASSSIWKNLIHPFPLITENTTIPSTELPLSKDFHLLAGDASSRAYWRYRGKDSVIITRYPEYFSKESMKRFLYWQKKYKESGVFVPEIYFFDLDRQVVVQQDVGDVSLQKLVGCSTDVLEKQWLQASLVPLQKILTLKFADYPWTMPAFTVEKLSYEIQNTLNFFVGILQGKEKEKERLFKLWMPLLKKISQLPVVLCHRDYHSKNLMCVDNELAVIDFQDSMLGPIQYDLCSLLDDCYLKYRPKNYQTAMREFFDYAKNAGVYHSSYDDFFQHYHFIKLQRQFKAIGSFCYVWSQRNNVKYLKYISYVMESMKTSFEVLELQELFELKMRVLDIYYE
jgi:aminoglycoside/choline kinase family phosphotransferase